MNVIFNLPILRRLNPKHLINLGIVSIGIVLLLTATQSLHAKEVVNFPDANLEKAIRGAIGKPAGDIFDTDLLTITSLASQDITHCDPRKNIEDLTGLEYCTNLQHLNLQRFCYIDNQIIDLSPLSGLNNLRFLDLDFNQISDLKPLNRLSNLKWLRLSDNQISNLTPLVGLTDLETLSLGNNQITDISPLAGLTKIGEGKDYILVADDIMVTAYIHIHLRLSGNQICDISPLVSNTGLGEGDGVYLKDNPLNDETYNSHIPALQARGVEVIFDPRPERVPQITVNPDSIAFGEVIVGEPVSATALIGNTGNAELKVTNITSNLGAIFTISETEFTVPPGTAHEIALTLTAAAKGEINGILKITSNNPNCPKEISISGSALAATTIMAVKGSVFMTDGITLAPNSVDEGKTLTINVTADDSDGDEVTITHSDLPENATFVDGIFTFKPSQTQADEYSITFTADDGNGGRDTQTVTVTVTAVNVAPQLLSVGSKEVIEGQTLSFEVDERQLLELVIEAYDEDEDTLNYSVDDLPKGATLDGKVLQWIPSTDTVTAKEEIKKFKFKVSVNDGKLSDSADVEVTVAHVDETASVVVTADPQSLPVKTTSKITVTLKDLSRKPVTDEVVTLQAYSGSITSPATHIGDGVYVSEYTAGTTPGTVTVTAMTSSGKSGETKLTVTEGGIAKLFISQPPTEIHAGEKHQFTISGEDAYGNSVNVKNTDVTWQVTGGIGKVDNNGLFTATTVGQGVVTAALKAQPNITAQTEMFNVLAGSLAAIAISPAPSEMRAGEEHQFTISGEDAYGNSVSVQNKDVSWQVIGGIGDVDENGLFTAKTIGIGKVKASLKENPTITAETQTIQIIAGDIALLAISEAPETMQVGETCQFNVSGEDAYGNSVGVRNSEVSWEVIDGIGGISEDGLFTAKTVGSGRIKAILKTDTKITAETKTILVVPGKIATLFISEAPSQMKAGETHQFTVSGEDAYKNAVSVQNTDVTWQVIGYGSIDENGLFTAKTIGIGKVKASLKENPTITAETQTIQIIAGDIALLAISEAPETMQAGETHQFNLISKDAYGNSVSVRNSEVSWEVIDGIGGISEDGLFTAKTVGRGKIKAILKTDTEVTAETKTILVVPGKPYSLVISPTIEQIQACETVQFTISGEDAYGNDAIVHNTDIFWQVIGDIGSINEDGLFAAKTAGNGKVEAMWKEDSMIIAETELFSVIAGPAAQSTLKATPDKLSPCQQSKLTAIVVDACGNPVADEKISIIVEPHNTGEIGIIKNEGNGVYTAVYDSPLMLGKVTITFTTSSSISSKAELSITELPKASPTFSTIEVDTSVFVGTEAVLKITVRDDKGNPIGGKRVNISAMSECRLTQPEVPTGCDGVTNAKIYCEKAGKKEITVSAPVDDVIIGKITVYFKPSEPYSVAITESPESLVANGESKATISILVNDIYGNPIPDEKVGLSASLGQVVSPAIYVPEHNVYKATYTATDKEGVETLTAKTSNGKTDMVSFPLKKLIVTATGSPAKAGKTIEVKLVGVAKGKTTFSIVSVEKATSVSMPEAEPGVYTGSYVVQDGDNVVDAVVKVTIIDQYNNVAIDDSQRVTLDTIPPPAPENLSVEGGKIDVKNVTKVKVTGEATSKVVVTVIFSDGEKEATTDVRADDTGAFVCVLDASKLKDGDILVEAFEEPDTAGNEGIKTNISVPKDMATFTLTAHPTEATIEARAGQFVVYQIILEGQNKFNQKIELSIEGLPEGLSAEFNPKTSLSQQEPKQTTQLNIKASESAVLGKHQFTVTASPEEGDSKEIQLALEVKPPKVTKTELLPNYPNPFYDSTWIPYQLHNEANVSIKIYNASGYIIRTLNLGHKPGGIYITKEFAASWNGRNSVGERAASGLYFCLFVAGDYQAIMLMVLL